jgi:hypothetical protein
MVSGSGKEEEIQTRATVLTIISHYNFSRHSLLPSVEDSPNGLALLDYRIGLTPPGELSTVHHSVQNAAFLRLWGCSEDWSVQAVQN